MGITATDLQIARGGVTVLAGVSFALDPGQALVLRGPNGVGKTSLLRTLAHLQPPAGGTFDLAPDRLAYAAHADAVKPTLTVAETLAFWARLYGGKVPPGTLARLNLAHLADRRGAELSAGQRRRTGLARLAVTGRPVWLLDEPTTALDTASVALFGQMMRDHLGQGGMAILATHTDLDLPARVLDLTPHREAARALVPGAA